MTVNQIHKKYKWWRDCMNKRHTKKVWHKKRRSGTWTSLLVWVLKGLNSMEGYMLCAVYMKSRCRCGCITVYRNWNCVWLLRRKIHSSKWHLWNLRHLHHYKLNKDCKLQTADHMKTYQVYYWIKIL